MIMATTQDTGGRTYSAEQARKDYSTPWLLYHQCRDICVAFGFTGRTWVKIRHLVDQKKLPCSHTRYSRESLLKQLM
jgi:hypothetical protein